MSSMLITFNGTEDNGQFIGDTIVSIKMAWLFAQAHTYSKIILTLSPSGYLNSLFKKFIDTYNVQVVYDTFDPGNWEQRWQAWDKWRNEREINGIKFDIYKELYRRIDGARRQAVLCGGEKGLNRKNIFEYFYYGQENVPDPPASISEFGDDLIYHPIKPAEHSVFISPLAKCQGNVTFTFDYWSNVVHKLIDAGMPVTVNHRGAFCDDLDGNPLYRKIFPPANQLCDEIIRHKVVACGNTGIGWVAGACGVPLLAMQPVDSNMQDYRYEWCGVKSLVEFMDQPDADYCCRRIQEIANNATVLTTGCYDVLHAGHIRHLEESRALGSRLVVCLNSDASVKASKGQDRPFNSQEQRAEVLKSIRYVDEVRIFDGENALPLIKEIRPMVITNGPDHKLEEIVGKEFVEQYGGRAVVTSGTRTTSSTKTIHKMVKMQDVLKAVRDGTRYSVNPFNKLKLLADQFISVANLPGDVADFGTMRGGSALVLQRIAPEKDLLLIDTWTGNPYTDPLCHHRKGEWGASLEECKQLLGQAFNTHWVVGVFPYSAERYQNRLFSFAFIDCDTYQAVKDAIAWFWPRIVDGGKMYFDDYGWEPCAGVKKAIDEAFSEDQRIVYAAQHACVVMKKSRKESE